MEWKHVTQHSTGVVKKTMIYHIYATYTNTNTIHAAEDGFLTYIRDNSIDHDHDQDLTFTLMHYN